MPTYDNQPPDDEEAILSNSTSAESLDLAEAPDVTSFLNLSSEDKKQSVAYIYRIGKNGENLFVFSSPGSLVDNWDVLYREVRRRVDPKLFPAEFRFQLRVGKRKTIKMDKTFMMDRLEEDVAAASVGASTASSYSPPPPPPPDLSPIADVIKSATGNNQELLNKLIDKAFHVPVVQGTEKQTFDFSAILQLVAPAMGFFSTMFKEIMETQRQLVSQRALSPAGTPASGGDELERFMRFARFYENLKSGEPLEEVQPKHWAVQMIESLSPAITEMMGAVRAQAEAKRIEVSRAAAVPMPGVPSPVPAPVSSPSSSPPSQDPVMLKRLMIAQKLRPYEPNVRLLLSLSGQDPATVASIIWDKIPEEADLDEVRSYLVDADIEEVFFAIFPDAQPHRVWVTTIRDLLVKWIDETPEEGVEDDEEGDEQETSPEGEGPRAEVSD